MLKQQSEQSLPRRDLWLLPLVSILTIFSIVSLSEAGARASLKVAAEDVCSNFNGVHGRFQPNCTTRIKPPEGPWVENAYNDCGYRTAQSCGPKQKGSLRVAVIGSSFAYGFAVPYANTYSALEGESLKRRCGKLVDFQNVTSPGVDMLATYRRTDEALALKPDLLLLAIAPSDIYANISAEQLLHRNDAAVPSLDARIPERHDPLVKRVFVDPLRQSSAVYMLEHFMYQDPETYLRLYLLYGHRADFIKTSFSPEWQNDFSTFDLLLADMTRKARAASVPLVILIGPTVAAVAVENTPPQPSLDAYAFGNKIASIAAKYRVTVVDPLPLFKGVSNSMSLFYTVDGHLNAAGQPLVAQALDKEIVSGKYPGFSECQGR